MKTSMTLNVIYGIRQSEASFSRRKKKIRSMKIDDQISDRTENMKNYDRKCKRTRNGPPYTLGPTLKFLLYNFIITDTICPIDRQKR